MATAIEEAFTQQHLHGKTVLEMGCQPGVFTSRLAAAGFDVVGVDLNPSEFTAGFQFIQQDISDYSPGRQFDNVIAVSSFEHCGIERHDYIGGLDYHHIVAAKLQELVTPGGQLIVTCPFGPDEVWLVTEQHGTVRHGEVPVGARVRWGYRKFTKDTLLRIFHRLTVHHVEAFELKEGAHYGVVENWFPIDVDRGADELTGVSMLKRHTVIGAVFNKVN